MKDFELFVRFSHPNGGYEADQEQCRKLLKVNEIYKVAWLYAVSGTYTEVELEGLEGHRFNSAMFDFLETVPHKELFCNLKYTRYWWKDSCYYYYLR